MALLRCGACSHLREVPNRYIGKSVKCPQCKKTAPIYDTVVFVEKVLGKYQWLRKELQQAQHQLTPEKEPPELSAGNEEQQLLEDIDIHNTAALMRQDQYTPLLQWFEKRKVEVDVNEQAIDTTGFFDEVALSMGNDYYQLKVVTNQIKFIQQKGYTNVKVHLKNKNQKQIQTLTRFCRDLYDYSFVAKCIYLKQEKVIRLNLQTASPIVNFFNGEWLEWFVFMKLLNFCKEKELSISCLRNLTVTFANEDRHELDVFFLIDNRIPVCIECKSGEFRQDIDKYVKLRKRLELDKSQFILCVVELSQKQAQGLSSMYEVTFSNQDNFLEHVEQLL